MIRWILFFLSVLALLIPYPLRAADPPRYAPGEILVKFRSDRSAKPVATQLEALARKVGVRAEAPLLPSRPVRAAKPIPGRADLEAVARLTLAPGTDVMAAVAAYGASGLVEYAQPNYLYRTLDAPNDPRFSDQWSLQSVRWLAGWEATRNTPIRKTPIVAIIDSGLDYRHEDLAPVVWANPAEASGKPGVDDDGNGYVDDLRGWDFTDAPDFVGSGDYLLRDNDPMDEGGHGTHVAGIVGAAVNNGVGIAGVCPVGRLMALRAGFTFEGTTFLEDDDLAAAIAYAVENGADVINASWGDDDVSTVIRDAVRYAARNGVVFVAAAGNEGRPSLTYPAALGEAISVSALDSQDRLASFSTFGERLDLAAPGVGLLSTRVRGGYETRSGTSMAAPCVAGLAAWVLAYHPEFSPEQVRAVLKRSASDLGAPGRDASFGSGRIDVAKALATGASPVAQIVSPASGFGVSGDVDVTGIAAGTGAGYRLEWGAGTDPTSWTLIQQGPPTGRLQTLGRWSVLGLPDSAYTLRLTLQDGSGAEGRAVVTLDRTPPVFRWRNVVARLDSAQVRFFAEWETDDRVFATLRVRSPGRPDVLVDSPFIGRQHSLPLPDGIPEGSTTVRILARNVAGLSSQGADTTFTLRREAVTRFGFSEVVTLPDGYLINRASDFDGNGRPEIALMPYVTGQPFSPVKVFEKGAGWAFQEVFTSAEGFLPWNVGDVTGNGRQELMGATTGRVRLFEGPGAWPAQTVAEDNDAWGGDLADLDGDGRPEIIARSGQQRELRVLKYVGSSLTQAAFLSNPTAGTNQIGPHGAIADFDGDGRPEVVFGDSDGDLGVYEKQASALAFDHSWTEKGRTGSDARLVGGGEDLDGDGKREFIVARIDSLPGDDIERRWVVSVYQATGGNTYAVEWQTEILGVKTTGNGIAVGDLTGDGRPDFAVCALPDLYLFTATGPNTYRPVWYTPVDLTYAPLITDLDGNGRTEIAFNRDGKVRIRERDGATPGPSPPGPITISTDASPNRFWLTWSGPVDATYRVYRGTSADSLRLLTQGLTAATYVDTLTTAARFYFYAVSAVDGAGRESQKSNIVSVPTSPDDSPHLHAAPLTLRQVALFSMVALDLDTAQQPRHYTVLPDSISPTSANLDQDNRRVVLGFERELKAGAAYQLFVEGVKDTTGVPLAFPLRGIVVPLSMSDGLPTVPFDLNRNDVVDLEDFFLFAAAFGTSQPRSDFDGDGFVDFTDFFLFADAFGRQALK
ncbi:MAG: hypothetical protein EXS64_20170 [Candidatus Latescibacteria bacterium]|nr:hypothetical protein [Candidatus Latescibacterota bacterium]